MISPNEFVSCRNGEYDKAIADYKQALAINPDSAKVYNALAWLYATCPDKKYRDGKKAVDSASKACHLTEGTAWPCLDTLAAAYAESGDFEKAKQWEAKAIEMAPDAKECRSRMELYKQGKPYREESK
jgi:tetratricopeptide (TPR) repeat protein